MLVFPPAGYVANPREKPPSRIAIATTSKSATSKMTTTAANATSRPHRCSMSYAATTPAGSARRSG
jgi:hypothetical protein